MVYGGLIDAHAAVAHGGERAGHVVFGPVHGGRLGQLDADLLAAAVERAAGDAEVGGGLLLVMRSSSMYRSDFGAPGRRMSLLTTRAPIQFGKANATRVPPLGRPLLPPPAEMTTYCRPLTM